MIKNAHHIAILGAGISGTGAAVLAKKKGYKPFVSDLGQISEEHKATLEKHAIPYEEGKHDFVKILSSDFVIKSPGIPDKVLIIKELKNQGTPVVSEIEFASWFTNATVIGITGSNGKTTTTLLTYQILKNEGLDVALGGNIGDGFAMQLAESDHDYWVLEISSFQLDDCKTFRPHISVITNITPDHLDRYQYEMELYVASKISITKNQTNEDFFIYNQDDEHIVKNLDKVHAQAIPFSLTEKLATGACLNNDKHIEINLNKHGKMTIEKLALQGQHNAANSMASALSAKLLGIRNETVRESLSNFESLEHRLEPVLAVHGIDFINDSKATNINSTYYALESMKNPTVWIVGGVDKGNDYSQLTDMVDEKVKSIVCLGQDNSKIHAEFEDHVEMIVDAKDMQEAVRMAYALGRKGDTVLLSPACASFDLFQNYEERGRMFKKEVQKL